MRAWLAGSLMVLAVAGNAWGQTATARGAGGGKAEGLVRDLLSVSPESTGGDSWRLAGEIGKLGDDALPALEAARGKAATPWQRYMWGDAVSAVHTEAGTKMLVRLVNDKDEEVRERAANGLRDRMVRPEREGETDAIVPVLIKACPAESGEQARRWMVMAMRVPLELDRRSDVVVGKMDAKWAAAAVELLKERLRNDKAEKVRFEAACDLGEYGDAAGLEELKTAIVKMQASERRDEVWPLERLVPAVEKVSGKSFGPVPINPMIANDSRTIPELERQRKEMVEKLAVWAEEGK